MNNTELQKPEWYLGSLERHWPNLQSKSSDWSDAQQNLKIGTYMYNLARDDYLNSLSAINRFLWEFEQSLGYGTQLLKVEPHESEHMLTRIKTFASILKNRGKNNIALRMEKIFFF